MIERPDLAQEGEGRGQQRIDLSYYFGVFGSKRLFVVRRQQGNGLVEPVLLAEEPDVLLVPGDVKDAAFCREAVDESLDLRKELVRPKILRSHDRSPTLVSKPVGSLAQIT